MNKNFFLNLVLLKEKVFSISLLKYKFLLLPILFFAILWPLQPAYAIFEGLADLIANAVFLVFFKIFIEIGNMILQLSLLLLNWVLSDGFIPWAYTSTNAVCTSTIPCNPIISIGWTLTRDLANMSFVVILVAIGLGTALKLGEYQVQKTLPTLILIALLINFTPVLLGLMVDASNITMNFFLEKVSGLDAWGRVSESQSSTIIQTLKNGGVILGLIPAIFQAIMLFMINVLSAAIIIAFAGLFMIRYVAIWILVILSPIVFALYILPSTRKMYWHTWWSQFTQWTIIGIPAAFFLYLGNHIMIAAPSMNLNPPSGGIWDVTFLNFIRSIMPYGIALMFLWYGFFTALSSSASGASGVINTVKKGVSKGRNWAQNKGKSFASRRLAENEGFQKLSQRLSTMNDIKGPTWGQGQTGLGAWAKRRAASVAGMPLAPLKMPGVKQATAELGRRAGRAGLGLTETAKKEIDRAEKELENASVEMIVSKFKSTTDWATKIGYMNVLAKKGKMDEALGKGLKSEDITKTMLKAEKYGAGQDIISAMPTLKENEFRTRLGIPVGTTSNPAPPLTALQTSQMANLYSSEVISKIKNDKAGQISPANLKRPEIMESIIKTWDKRHFEQLLKAHGREAVDSIETRIEQLAAAVGVNPMEWLEGRPAQLPQPARPATPATPHPTIAGVMVPGTPAVPATPGTPAIQGANPRLASYMKSNAGREFFRIR